MLGALTLAPLRHARVATCAAARARPASVQWNVGRQKILPGLRTRWTPTSAFKEQQDRRSGESPSPASAGGKPDELQDFVSKGQIAPELAQFLATKFGSMQAQLNSMKEDQDKMQVKLEATEQRAMLSFEPIIRNLASEGLKLLTGATPEPEPEPHPVQRFNAKSAAAKGKLGKAVHLLPQHRRPMTETQLAAKLNALIRGRNAAIHHRSKDELEAAIKRAVPCIDDPHRQQLPLECWVLECYEQLVPIFGYKPLKD